ncbi:MAG: FlgD immunoglobulin-like domain containing protein [Candidatus Latescibacterota bacterium]|nr:FlgD immunoglobulin-like domain containing protein [Candidatus Latescibacterota bacterium]
MGLLTVASAFANPPTFENKTPVGFIPDDSTTTTNFVTGNSVTVRVDLNQAVNSDYPLVGNFHALERAEQLSTVNTDGMWVDVAMVDVVPFGTNANIPEAGVTSAASFLPALHVAWIEGSPNIRGQIYTGGSTPAYQVMYTRSHDGGATFSDSVSVTGTISYHLQSTNGSGSSFSTLDLEVDSGGNPRIVYAMVHTGTRRRDRDVYFTYSADGGGSWKTPIVVNDTITDNNTEGYSAAFPRMAIDDRDEIFISYVRGTAGGSDDVMLAKVNREPTTFSMFPIGSLGTAGSSGGLRISPNTKRHTGPDIAIGDGDGVHVTYFSDADNRIEHKRLASDTTWVDVSATGWNQDADGATVANFVDENGSNVSLEEDATYFSTTVVVDRNQLPDRVYALFKGNNNSDPNESIAFASYRDDGTVTGSGASWGTPGPVFSTGQTPLFDSGLGKYNIELDWTITGRVAAIVDDAHDDRGDLHIAFTAGHSGSLGTFEHDVFYARYNGTSWTLPENVADDDSDATATDNGIANTDVYLQSPSLAMHPNFGHVFLGFAGGTDEGFGVNGVGNVNHHPYVKVLGRAITSEDESVPVGAYEYTLSYTPTNPISPSVRLDNRIVYVHAADPRDGSGLGAKNSVGDGFLAGAWERVGTRLQDTEKRFEGLADESSGDNREWGDNQDKVGLLAKLNVLGSDSSGNLQLIVSSSGAERAVQVGSAPTVSLAAGRFFSLGAHINIVATNSAPTVSISNPSNTGDTANASYAIRYDLADSDDDLNSSLDAALYAYSTDGLASVQDIRIFATLIADENDVSARNANGTNDFIEGSNQTYTWDDAPAALQSGSLFASILKVQSGRYYIYLVADDGQNPPVFAVSPGALTIEHSPIVRSIDPIVADTVDTGVRTGLKANPYDLDFSVIDYDNEARVQLFYAAVSGISSVSATGTYPNQSFVLGKSLSGTRGTAITNSTTLSNHDREFAWDVTDPLIVEGAYYLYAVASDRTSVTVANSSTRLVVAHSPSFTFYEPARNTQRNINSGSQPAYTIQWQKGPGDGDLDDNATIALYFTTVDPATKNYSGDDSTDLLNPADGNARLIVNGLREDDEGDGDLYVWDLTNPPHEVPVTGTRVWLYAELKDGSNETVTLGGSLTIDHNPYILLRTRLPEIDQGDLLRLSWDDYMVDDGFGTDDAYIRLYASTGSSFATLQDLEADVVGASGTDEVFIVNSSDGSAKGIITSIRESGANSFIWDTWTSRFSLPEGDYNVYAGISKDPTFSNNTRGRVSVSGNELVVNPNTGTIPNFSLSPNRLRASARDTLEFEILVQSGGVTAKAVSAVLEVDTDLFTIVNSASPFTDLNEILTSGTVIEDTTISSQIRYTKQHLSGEIIGSEDDPARLASFQLVAKTGFSGSNTLRFHSDEASLSLANSSVPLDGTNGMSSRNALIEALPRARILGTVLLEGRSPPIGNGDHTTLLDVHLRLPGSTVDIDDSSFLAANDDDTGTSNTIEVQTAASGGLVLTSVPTGRYVLTVKDSSHISGRTDTITLRNGETLTLTGDIGFFASDIRGNGSLLLDKDGQELKGGDATGDNEIDEDDVNTIDSAWGTNTAVSSFAHADINNDGRVGVKDLAVTTSNISNLTGFGAPPVFRAASSSAPGIEVSAPGKEGPWRTGDEIELVFAVRAVRALAAFGMELVYDPMEMAVLGDEAGAARVGELFAGNPTGYFSRMVESGSGRLDIAASRLGKEWSASGDGDLLGLPIRLHQDGYPSSLRIVDGQLIAADFTSQTMQVMRDPVLLALPAEFALGANYPNPFNPATTIPFRVPPLAGVEGHVPVSVSIFNALGQRIRVLLDKELTPGYHQMQWDGFNQAGSSAASGRYFYQVQVGPHAQTGRMTLLK